MFRENLKDQIEYKGLILKELALKTGISKRTIDTYVDSRAVIPNAEIAVKLAKALDTTVEYLVTGTSSSNMENSKYFEKAKLNKYRNMLLDFEKLSPELQESIKNMIHIAAKEK